VIRPSLRLCVVETVGEIAAAAAPIVIGIEREAIARRGEFRVALAGGSTPRPLYELLAAARDPHPSFECWQVFFGDERMVAADHPDSNYRMAREALFERAPIAPQQIHRVPTETGSAAQTAAAYNAELQRCFALAAGQLPRFDLVLLGMGADGHTASLFPGSSALTAPPAQPVVANWVDRLHADRITLTSAAINAARAVVFLVSGADKAPALRAVLAADEGATPPERVPPARTIAPVDGELVFVTDRAAAALATD